MFTLYQIPHLITAQRATAKIVITPHQLFPYMMYFAISTAYLDYFYLSKFRQITPYFRNICYPFIFMTLLILETRPLMDLWQIDDPLPMQFQKRYTTTHIFQSSIGTAPIKSFTYPLRQLCTRYLLIFCYYIFYQRYIIRRKFFAAYYHAVRLTNFYPLCPVKNVEHGKFPKRGIVPPSGKGSLEGFYRLMSSLF